MTNVVTARSTCCSWTDCLTRQVPSQCGVALIRQTHGRPRAASTRAAAARPWACLVRPFLQWFWFFVVLARSANPRLRDFTKQCSGKWVHKQSPRNIVLAGICVRLLVFYTKMDVHTELAATASSCRWSIWKYRARRKASLWWADHSVSICFAKLSALTRGTAFVVRYMSIISVSFLADYRILSVIVSVENADSSIHVVTSSTSFVLIVSTLCWL